MAPVENTDLSFHLNGIMPYTSTKHFFFFFYIQLTLNNGLQEHVSKTCFIPNSSPGCIDGKVIREDTLKHPPDGCL